MVEATLRLEMDNSPSSSLDLIFIHDRIGRNTTH
jgi:hypothetical protein